MGRTPVPLVIYAPAGDVDRPELQALVAKGHQVRPFPVDIEDADIILGPRAHAWPLTFWSKPTLLDLALKRARARHKERKAPPPNGSV